MTVVSAFVFDDPPASAERGVRSVGGGTERLSCRIVIVSLRRRTIIVLGTVIFTILTSDFRLKFFQWKNSRGKSRDKSHGRKIVLLEIGNRANNRSDHRLIDHRSKKNV